MAAKNNPVVASAVLENMSLDGQIDWKIEDFESTIKAYEALDSDDFKFFFPRAKKSFRFALQIVQGSGFSYFYLINRNSEAVQISGVLKVGTMSYTFSGKIEGAPSCECKKYLTRLSSGQLQAESSAGSLLISVKFSIFDDLLKSAKASRLEPVDADLEFHQSHRNLMSDTTFSDFVIECGTEKFPCHKAILASRSDVFARLFSTKGWVENKRNLYKINDHDPAVVKQMREFIYTNKIPDGTEYSLELLLIADQFNLKDLIRMCETAVSKTMTRKNAIKILNVANKVADAKRLKDSASKFVVENILSIVSNDAWKEVFARSNLLDVLESIKSEESRESILAKKLRTH